MLALCQAPERVEGKDLRETSAKTTGFATHMLAFSQAPEHVEGGGGSMRKEEVVLDS
jgi:hypothetical protein